MHESQLHEVNSFITLTYNNTHLPKDGGLDVTHWQKFAKRLRKHSGPFRFYHCGEYGDTNQRPHYHAAIFGLDFSGDREIWEQKEDRITYISESLSNVWGQGFCTVGDLTWSSAAYVARYILKKQKADQETYIRVSEESGDAWLVKPEYTTMSRRPGLGSGWIKKYKSDVFPLDYVVNDKGRKMRTPKFYDQFLTDEEKESVKIKRRKAAEKYSYDQCPDRLAVRERVQKARQSQLRRNL